MNYWHDIEAGTPDEINVIIEIQKGSKNKYEIDKKTGLIALDRVMHSAQDYPFDYGFVPQTLWHDGDPVDVVVLTTYPLNTGILLTVRPVAIMGMIDGGEADDKMIAVPCNDPRWDSVIDLQDINKHTLKEIEHFFLTYKNIQNKKVEVTGFQGKDMAIACFTEGKKLYEDKFPRT